MSTATLHETEALVRASADLGVAAEMLRLLPIGVCLMGADGCLQLANDAFMALYGLTPARCQPGVSWAELWAAMPGVESEDGEGGDVSAAAGAAACTRECRLPDGRLIRVSVTPLSDGRALAWHEDVTDRRQSHDRSHYLANHDVMTGLPNRSALHEALSAACAVATPHAALLCLDLDQFKAVNDRFGHTTGDELLRQVAERLQLCVRKGDLVARLGGDEFAILQYSPDQPGAAKSLGRRLAQALEAPFALDAGLVHIGTSIGVAVLPFDGPGPDELLKHADLALYQAKDDGRGALRFFEPGMDERAVASQALSADLRQALDRGEFALAYQVQVDTHQGVPSGVEALLRWNHPTQGRVSPDRFIPLAEQTGLIVPIGRWVLAQACRDAMAWPAHLRVAVNVSAVQFRFGSLIGDVAQALARSGLPAHRLELEITESVMLQEPDNALRILQELRRQGVKVALDDFGTGYSSLATLRSFPFDRIKIDRSFVRDVETKAEALAIVRAVAALGRSLGMATTVEGVETPPQLAAVTREGCTEVQGYLFSRPEPAERLPAEFARLAEAGAASARPPTTATGAPP